MDFKCFTKSKHELQLPGRAIAICYLGTHLANAPEERVCIYKAQDGSLSLQIENHEYKGELDELEKILWDWFRQD
jgi:hypothetical protein